MIEHDIERTVCAAVAAASDKDLVPRLDHRLIDDLDFDSLRMTRLAIELEAGLGQSVLLNDWVASAPELSDLTVGSLAEHVRRQLAEND